MKVNNENKVLEKIIITGGISRAELSRKLHLNKATTSYLMDGLEKNNIVAPKEELKKTNGRYSVLYEINRDYSNILVIDIKPREIFAYIVDLHGNAKKEFHYLEKIKSEKKLKEFLVEIISEILLSYPNLIGIGIGIHGLVDKDFVIKLAPNNNIKNLDIRKYLTNKFPEYSFYVENEANISALGESQLLDEKTAINITNGKGIGCGIIIDYKIYRGANGLAGEIGHTIIEPNGLQCSCGNRGCLEQYASEENLFDTATKIKGYEIKKEKFVELFESGDKDIQKLYFKSLDYLAITLHNAILFLNPSTLILTGYLYSNIEVTLDYLKEKFNTSIMNVNNYFISDLNKNTMILGFTKLIVQNFFLKENKYKQ